MRHWELKETVKHWRCPDEDTDPDFRGCGHEFDAVKDNQGWVECPNCKMHFTEDGKRASAGYAFAIY